METPMEYQGYGIQSSPQYDATWEEWQPRIVISAKDHQGIRSRECKPPSGIRPSRRRISKGLPLADGFASTRDLMVFALPQHWAYLSMGSFKLPDESISDQQAINHH